MDGALCRCMTYYRVQAAIKRVVRGTTTAGAAK
jgi:aerobic-type carbon monoxide dehydrogenase small subunit (CoxS/CutS family)